MVPLACCQVIGAARDETRVVHAFGQERPAKMTFESNGASAWDLPPHPLQRPPR